MIIPVVLCGGSGTRLWPLSRRDFAKQHVPIFADRLPFQHTLARVATNTACGRPLLMTSVVGRFMASDQASAVGVEIDMLVEPEARDTLPAIAAATEWVAKRDPESLLLILPSDQMISDVAAFAETGGVECPR